MIAKTEKSELVAAIAKVMGSIGKLGKENFNKFDRYNFTSIDDFMAATGKACSEKGLAIIQNETKRETIEKTTSKGKSNWLLIEFSFTVLHESGESLEPLSRSVAVPFTGAQSFGSAQSYSLKQFMRSLFQIATGDTDDADLLPQDQPTPTIDKPDPPVEITDDTIETILGIVAKSSAFPTTETFHRWVEKYKGKVLGGLDEPTGRALIRHLTESPDPSSWNEKMVTALTECLQENAESASKSPM